MWYWILVCLIAIPMYIMFPTKIVGRRNIPKKGRVLLCGNHQSNADVLLFATHFRKQKYLAKIELKKKFFIGPLLSSIGVIYVNRNKPGVDVYRKVCKHLNNDGAMTIFPEGTRKKITPEESMEMKNGVALFALKTNSPVVPVAIIKKPKLFRPNILVVGEPFYFEKVDKITKEVLEQDSKILSNKILTIRNDYLKSHPKVALFCKKQEEKLQRKK